MKTLNERVKELVSQVILDSEYEKLQKASKDVTSELENDPKFIELKKAVDAYKWEKFVNDTDYQKAVRGCLFTAFRAASKCIKDVNIPFEYMEDEKNLTKVATTFLCDTDARIASTICKVNDWFKPTKVTRSIEFVPYTIAEIRKLVELIQLGILEREKVRQQVREGKRKR